MNKFSYVKNGVEVVKNEGDIISFDDLRSYQPPQDVLDKLNEARQKYDLTYEKILEKFYKYVCSPSYMMFGDIDYLLRSACEMMLANLASTAEYKETHGIYFHCIAKTGIKSFQKEKAVLIDDKTSIETKKGMIATIYGLFQKTKDKKPLFGVLTLWNDACQMLDFVEPRNTYFANILAKKLTKESLTASGKHKKIDDRYALTLSDFTKFDKPELIKDIPLEIEVDTPFQDINQIKNSIISVGEVDSNIGEFKIVHGKIANFKTSINKKGNMQGNLILDGIGDKSKIRTVWWNAPEFVVKYRVGTEVYVMMDLKKDEKYGISGIGHFIVPVKPVDINPANNKIMDLW
ncbi:hypothetical protein [Methanosarcina mazei]|uniref:Uncharacterized protein n=1 Tax=Methanosarcina mazei TaxID=2209 RepID=A0A0F8PQ28_METMZ|nr:hypothetical protein [Methanosarcina mazei]KKH38979.1 hypothetical protein DU71_01345 [Methanosarcina mazei]KKH43583.1 hypothetical protein DU72_00015 [Methanosarcina mazei]QIB91270.1 hypothetical protein FQU78_09665 [Methanosarcina mazei]